MSAEIPGLEPVLKTLSDLSIEDNPSIVKQIEPRLLLVFAGPEKAARSGLRQRRHYPEI